MAVLIEEERLVPAWSRAAEALLAAPGRSLSNILLEITDPRRLTPADVELMKRVDLALRANCGMTVETVASTIFPNGLYRRTSPPDFYDKAVKSIERGRKPGTWGTYALRLMRRQSPDGTWFNPLKDLVAKVDAMKSRKRMWQDVLELGVHDASDPEIGGEGCELALYDPDKDRTKYTNMQCLSHLSFKIAGRDRLDLTAMYRSHYYAEKTLGNLVGLSQLMAFITTETGLKMGTLTCLSTHAYLDNGLGSKQAVRSLLKPAGV